MLKQMVVACSLEAGMIWTSDLWMVVEIWLSILYPWIGQIWQKVQGMPWMSDEVKWAQEV
jgi:hypothetical protein